MSRQADKSQIKNTLTNLLPTALESADVKKQISQIAREQIAVDCYLTRPKIHNVIKSPWLRWVLTAVLAVVPVSAVAYAFYRYSKDLVELPQLRKTIEENLRKTELLVDAQRQVAVISNRMAADLLESEFQRLSAMEPDRVEPSQVGLAIAGAKARARTADQFCAATEAAPRNAGAGHAPLPAGEPLRLIGDESAIDRLHGLSLGFRVLQQYFQGFEGRLGRLNNAGKLAAASASVDTLLTNGNETQRAGMRALVVSPGRTLEQWSHFAAGTLRLKLVETDEASDSQLENVNKAVQELEQATAGCTCEKARGNLAAAYIYRYRLNGRVLFDGEVMDAKHHEECAKDANRARMVANLSNDSPDRNLDPEGDSVRLANLAEAYALEALASLNAPTATAALKKAIEAITQARELPRCHPCVHMASAQIRAVECLLECRGIKKEEWSGVKSQFRPTVSSDLINAARQEYQTRFRDAKHLLDAYRELQFVFGMDDAAVKSIEETMIVSGK